jgi:hypothetical protein
VAPNKVPLTDLAALFAAYAKYEVRSSSKMQLWIFALTHTHTQMINPYDLAASVISNKHTQVTRLAGWR